MLYFVDYQIIPHLLVVIFKTNNCNDSNDQNNHFKHIQSWAVYEIEAIKKPYLVLKFQDLSLKENI